MNTHHKTCNPTHPIEAFGARSWAHGDSCSISRLTLRTTHIVVQTRHFAQRQRLTLCCRISMPAQCMTATCTKCSPGVIWPVLANTQVQEHPDATTAQPYINSSQPSSALCVSEHSLCIRHACAVSTDVQVGAAMLSTAQQCPGLQTCFTSESDVCQTVSEHLLISQNTTSQARQHGTDDAEVQRTNIADVRCIIQLRH